MKRSRFSEEQIIGILKEAESGGTTKAVCAKYNINDGMLYAWKRKYGGMDVKVAQQLRALEEENGRLKRLVADQAMQIQILKEVNSKNGKPVNPASSSEAMRGNRPWQYRRGMPGVGIGAFELLPGKY